LKGEVQMNIKNRPEVRYALWQAYQRKCSICLEDMFNYSDLEIDHIIPEAKFKDIKKVQEIINKFNLPLEFNFNGLENLRPAHHKCNNDKRDNELPDEITVRLLRRAKSKIKDVKKYINKFEEEAKHALNIEVIRKQLNEGQITLEEYVDRINNYVSDFGVEDYKSFSADRKFLRYKNKTVILEGYLPTVGENRGSCLFTFNSFYIRGTNISLNHKEIFSELYPGNNTPLEFDLRRYIVAKLDEDNFIIQLGNSRFNLNYEEVSNLCSVIDKFINEYVSALKELEEIIDCKDFHPNYYDSSNYHLLKVNMSLWSKILEFSRVYDYENGNTKWHIFDASGNNMLKIYIKDDTEIYNRGYKCIIHSFIEDHYSWTPSDNVWLLWTDMSMTKEYGTKDYWTVDYTYNWLIKELIPEVIKWASTVKPKSFFKKKQYSEGLQNYNYYFEGELRYISPSNVENSERLKEIVNELHLFYSTNSYRSVNKEEVRNIYKAILKSFKKCKSPDYHYICSKLDIDSMTSNPKNIINYLENKIIQYDGFEIIKLYSSQIDLLFRVLHSNLTDMMDKLEIDDIRDYLELIDWYIKEFNTEKLIESYK